MLIIPAPLPSPLPHTTSLPLTRCMRRCMLPFYVTVVNVVVIPVVSTAKIAYCTVQFYVVCAAEFVVRDIVCSVCGCMRLL